MYFTPHHVRDEARHNGKINNSSSSHTPHQSILRSSSNYTDTMWQTGSSHKRVTIVSPIAWRSQSKHALKRRRNFITSTITYSDLLDILGYGAYSIQVPTYEECVDILLNLDWSPDIEENMQSQRKRAKPTIADDDREIYFKSTDTEYLSRFSVNNLREWIFAQGAEPFSLTYNKYECIKVIQNLYPYLSPSRSCDATSRINREPGDSTTTKMMSRTPHRFRQQLIRKKRTNAQIRKQLSFE